MELTSSPCRAQESMQWERAKDEPPGNVRIVALRAAATWGFEAEAAERREVRKRRKSAIAAAVLEQRQWTDNDGRTFSENPDRGFADD